MDEISIELDWHVGDSELTHEKYHTEHTIKINELCI